jgi:hypothetical protein
VFDLDRPFNRLIHHYVVRIFHGAGEGDDLQFSIPALLGLLSVPSAFSAVLLLDKYSTLKMFLLGIRNFDPYRASIPDEYSFIVYSMFITGAVVILKWDRLFPDKQDYDNLASLPLSASHNFAASLAALLMLAALFAAVINGAASVIFPFAVTAQFDTFAAYSEFFVAHTAAVLLASFFTCFSLLLLMGVTILVSPRRYTRAVSLFIRILCALALIGMLSTVFTLPRLLQSGEGLRYAGLLPSLWFLDLNQMLLSQGTQWLHAGTFAFQMTVVTFILSIAVYTLTYYGEYMRIPERNGHAGGGQDGYSLHQRLVDATLLTTPFQRATYHFAFKTLFRSERHCLLFGVAFAIGVFLAAQAFAESMTTPSETAVDPRLLSVSLTVAYFVIVSLHALFDLPSDRRANWIFQTTVDSWSDGRSVAGKCMTSAVAFWLIPIGLPLHVLVLGWPTALLHTIYVLISSLALAELLLIRFRKIPFTCTYTASKDKVLVHIVLVLAGLSIFADMNAVFEARLLRQPMLFVPVVSAFLAGRLWIRQYRENLPPADRMLVFEDRPAPVVQRLDLS